jgi:hypothetical protein
MNDKIIDRVRKLLELSKSANVHEAANAAAAAQELMTRFEISSSVLSQTTANDEDDEPIETGLMHATDGSQLPTWKGQLAVCVAEVNQCKAWRSGPSLHVIGRPSDASKVRTLFINVACEIERLAGEGARERGNPGRTWVNNFRLGAVGAVSKRLREGRQKAVDGMRSEAATLDGGGIALVRVNHAISKLNERSLAVQQYAEKNLNLRARSSTRTTYDSDARRAGERAGGSIDLSNKARLGSGERKMLT